MRQCTTVITFYLTEKKNVKYCVVGKKIILEYKNETNEIETCSTYSKTAHTHARSYGIEIFNIITLLGKPILQ